MDKDSSELLIACQHEAGHIVMAWLMGITMAGVAIHKSGIDLELSVAQKLHRIHFASWEHSKRFIRFLLAGRQAELLLFGYSTVGASADDYSRARMTALGYAKQNEIELLEKETHALLDAQRDVVRRVAGELEQKRTLTAFDLGVMQMNWLARGKC